MSPEAWQLENVQPPIPPDYLVHVCGMDTITHSKFTRGHASMAKITDFPNHLHSQLRHAVLLTKNCPAFPVPISSVVGVGAGETVVEADAEFHIAVMAHALSLGGGAILKFVGDTVGQHVTSLRLLCEQNTTIAVDSLGPHPQPAGLCLFNVGPET